MLLNREIFYFSTPVDRCIPILGVEELNSRSLPLNRSYSNAVQSLWSYSRLCYACVSDFHRWSSLVLFSFLSRVSFTVWLNWSAIDCLDDMCWRNVFLSIEQQRSTVSRMSFRSSAWSNTISIEHRAFPSNAMINVSWTIFILIKVKTKEREYMTYAHRYAYKSISMVQMREGATVIVSMTQDTIMLTGKDGHSRFLQNLKVIYTTVVDMCICFTGRRSNILQFSFTFLQCCRSLEWCWTRPKTSPMINLIGLCIWVWGIPVNSCLVDNIFDAEHYYAVDTRVTLPNGQYMALANLHSEDTFLFLPTLLRREQHDSRLEQYGR